MSRSLVDIKRDCLKSILQPVLRFCIRHGISVQQVIETVKTVSLELASQEMEAAGEKATVSRLSVITGLQRRDITRLQQEKSTESATGSLAMRVLGQWENAARYQGKNKQPKVLSQDEFRDLVSRVSTDVNPATLLFELERTGSIERTSAGQVQLKRRNYIPKGDPQEGFRVLAKDCDDLICSVEENVFEDESPNLHGRTDFDNIAGEHLDEIRKWLVNEGSQFHQRVRQYLSKFDLDINPDAGKSGGAQVSLGTFSRMRGSKK